MYIKLNENMHTSFVTFSNLYNRQMHSLRFQMLKNVKHGTGCSEALYNVYTFDRLSRKIENDT